MEVLNMENIYIDPVYQDADLRKKRANTLCLISLGSLLLTVLTFIANYVLLYFYTLSYRKILMQSISTAESVAFVASWVFMIIVRARYKESKFAKILMWVYISIAATTVTSIVVLIAYCFYTCSGIPG